MKILLDLIRLNFTAPLHISNPRSDYARSEKLIHSDVITAAVMQAWASLGKSEWITDNPGFVVSDLFPFVKINDSYIYFFPRPVKDKPPENLPPALLKNFKRIRYYQKEIFEKRLSGKLTEIAGEQIKGEFLVAPEIINENGIEIFSSSVLPRIMRPRNPAENSVPFYMEKLYFRKNSGLFFLVHADDESGKSRLMEGLKYLSDNGIGSDRSVGNGRFEFSSDRIELNCPERSDYAVSLSLFIPESEQSFRNMLGEHASYDFIRRGGWISEPFNSLRKRSIYMLISGSILKMNTEGCEVRGKTVDLKPLKVKTHNAIYRSGKSLFLPVKAV